MISISFHWAWILIITVIIIAIVLGCKVGLSNEDRVGIKSAVGCIIIIIGIIMAAVIGGIFIW